MAKVSFNKFHRKFEVYFRNGKGKKHVGYYYTSTTANAVAKAVNATLVMS